MTEATPGAGSGTGSARPIIEPWLREILRCPRGKHELVDATGPDGQPELHCAEDCGQPGCRLAFRIDDGIPVLLLDEARSLTS